MPNYPGVANATVSAKSNLSPLAIAKGDSAYLFGVLAAGATQLPVNDGNVAGETPAAPQASIAIHLAPTSEGGPAPMITIEGLFSGAPGAFNVQIQEADTDADAFYITPSTSTYTITAVGANNQFRVDLSPTGGKFLRVLLSSRTNAVSFICKATRLA
jgi:hypothetical protein